MTMAVLRQLGPLPPPLDRPLLQLLVHGQRHLWRYVQEPLAQQEAHGPGRVAEELVQLLGRALLTVLLASSEHQRFDLLHTRGVLWARRSTFTRGGGMGTSHCPSGPKPYVPSASATSSVQVLARLTRHTHTPGSTARPCHCQK